MATEKKVEKKLTLADLKKRNKTKIGSFVPISTGSLSIDMASGIGGFPKGKIVEIFGLESSGKSTVAQMMCGEVIKNKENAVYLDAEYGFDPVYAKTLGFDIEHDNVDFEQPDGLEDTLQTAIDYAKTGEVSIIVIDSLSGPAPLKESEGKIGDSNMGIKARQISQFCRVITPILAKNNVLLIIIGQLREKIGVMFGSPETTDYGNAMKFYASMRIRVARKVSSDKTESTTTFTFKKNKCAVPFKVASFDLIHGEGIDKVSEIVDIALEQKVLRKEGNTYYYNETKLGGSRAKSIELLKDNIEMFDEIEQEVRKGIGVQKETGGIPLPTQSDEMGEMRELQESSESESNK